MSSREITDELVLTIYDWFRSAMGSVGRKVKPPKARNLAQTYTIRYVRGFAEKAYNEWQLDDKAVRTLVYDIVKYAAREHLLNRGTTVLNMSAVLDICKRSLQDSIEAEANLASELRRCDSFVQTIGKDNLVDRLIQPVTIGGYSNLVYWYNLGYLTPTYVALSRKCLKALCSLPESERAELPPDTEFLRICTHVVANENLDELKKVFGQDLRIPPTVRVR